jgi:thiol-disulfide isomerase/thioredoxin
MKKRSLAVVFIAAAVFLWADPPSQAVSGAFTRAGLKVVSDLKALPDFSAPLLGGGKTSLADYRGKVVFLNLWATWCGPCRSEMPSMEKLYQRYKDQGLEILAVNLREDDESIRTFMRQNGLSFPVVLDKSGDIGSLYGVMAIPTSYVLDRQGRVILRLVGSINWDRPEIYRAFEILLAE